MKKIRDYPLRRYSGNEPTTVQKAMYKPDPDELRQIEEAIEKDADSIMDDYDTWAEGEPYYVMCCRRLTGFRDREACLEGDKYTHYLFYLTRKKYLSVTRVDGCNC
jgi:hypothetical protein